MGDDERRAVARADQVGERHQPRERKEDQPGHRERREEQPAPARVRALEEVADPPERELSWSSGCVRAGWVRLTGGRGTDPVEHPALAAVRDQPGEPARPHPGPAVASPRRAARRRSAVPSSSASRAASASPSIRMNAPVAQVAEDIAGVIGIVVEALERPARAQARTHRAVAAALGGGRSPIEVAPTGTTTSRPGRARAGGSANPPARRSVGELGRLHDEHDVAERGSRCPASGGAAR